MKRFAFIAICALLAAQGAAAKPAHPDLSGYWAPMRTQPPMDPQLRAALKPGTVELMDTGPTELPAGDYGGLIPTPAALAAAKAWNPRDEMTVSKACSPPSIIYAMQGPFPIRIDQGTEIVVIRLEYYDMVRIVFMNRGHLPPDAPHTKTGDSVGHWEGPVLVVDTDHLESSTIANNGLNHSEDVHVIERFKLSADGKTLLSTQEFEDPRTLQNRGARAVAWSLRPGEYIEPYDCDPSFGLNYGAADK